MDWWTRRLIDWWTGGLGEQRTKVLNNWRTKRPEDRCTGGLQFLLLLPVVSSRPCCVLPALFLRSVCIIPEKLVQYCEIEFWCSRICWKL